MEHAGGHTHLAKLARLFSRADGTEIFCRETIRGAESCWRDAHDQMKSSPPLIQLAALATLLAFAKLASAQPASNATGAQQVVSPEVAADRSVTFRLYAPN